MQLLWALILRHWYKLARFIVPKFSFSTSKTRFWRLDWQKMSDNNFSKAKFKQLLK